MISFSRRALRRDASIGPAEHVVHASEIDRLGCGRHGVLEMACARTKAAARKKQGKERRAAMLNSPVATATRHDRTFPTHTARTCFPDLDPLLFTTLIRHAPSRVILDTRTLPASHLRCH